MCRLEDALRLALSHDIDAALLDINLSGALVYPLADLLREQGTPFHFFDRLRREGRADAVPGFSPSAEAVQPGDFETKPRVPETSCKAPRQPARCDTGSGAQIELLVPIKDLQLFRFIARTCGAAQMASRAPRSGPQQAPPAHYRVKARRFLAASLSSSSVAPSMSVRSATFNELPKAIGILPFANARFAHGLRHG